MGAPLLPQARGTVLQTTGWWGHPRCPGASGATGGWGWGVRQAADQENPAARSAFIIVSSRYTGRRPVQHPQPPLVREETKTLALLSPQSCSAGRAAMVAEGANGDAGNGAARGPPPASRPDASPPAPGATPQPPPLAGGGRLRQHAPGGLTAAAGPVLLPFPHRRHRRRARQ